MNKKPHVLGIIAGTPFDTHLGACRLEQMGYKTLQYFISHTPMEQTKLQEDSHLLTNLVSIAIDNLLKEGATEIILYCHSMSICINLHNLKKKHPCLIHSPTDTILKICKPKSKAAILSANNISIKRTEEMILKLNPNFQLIGVGLLTLVNSIENMTDFRSVLHKHGLIDLCRFFSKNSCDTLILACTHLECIYLTLKEELIKAEVSIKIIPIYKLMIDRIPHINPANL